MIITRTSPVSGIERALELPVTQEQLDNWQGGMLIQKACPNLCSDQLEFIKTGITHDEWNEIFGEEEEDDEDFEDRYLTDAEVDELRVDGYNPF